jgi:hypothetical protein
MTAEDKTQMVADMALENLSSPPAASLLSAGLQEQGLSSWVGNLRGADI